jgi:hypothetical protein
MGGEVKRWFAQYPAYNDPWHSVEVVLASDFDAQARELAEAVALARSYMNAVVACARITDTHTASAADVYTIARERDTLAGQVERVKALPRYDTYDVLKRAFWMHAAGVDAALAAPQEAGASLDASGACDICGGHGFADRYHGIICAVCKGAGHKPGASLDASGGGHSPVAEIGTPTTGAAASDPYTGDNRRRFAFSVGLCGGQPIYARGPQRSLHANTRGLGGGKP